MSTQAAIARFDGEFAEAIGVGPADHTHVRSHSLPFFGEGVDQVQARMRLRPNVEVVAMLTPDALLQMEAPLEAPDLEAAVDRYQERIRAESAFQGPGKAKPRITYLLYLNRW
jgi:hypothetical protein